jgi:hypothetical protein
VHLADAGRGDGLVVEGLKRSRRLVPAGRPARGAPCRPGSQRASFCNLVRPRGRACRTAQAP